MDLTKILKNAPRGLKLYSTVYGEVELERIDNRIYAIITIKDGLKQSFTRDGRICFYSDGECILFPSKDQRDWSKFTAPWYKEEKFDPKTLKPFDKVLVRMSNESYNTWHGDFVVEPGYTEDETPLTLGAKEANMVIPYNDDTKHLVGTTEEAPEYYKYWEE